MVRRTEVYRGGGVKTFRRKEKKGGAGGKDLRQKAISFGVPLLMGEKERR